MTPAAAARSAYAPRHATVAFAPPKRDRGFTAPRLASERDVLDQAAESHAPRSFLTIREVWNGLKSDLCPAHAVDGMTIAQIRGRIAKAGSRLVSGKLIRPSESTVSRYLTLLGEAGLLEFHFRGRVRAIVTHVTFPQVYEDNGGLAAHEEARERRLVQEREASQRYRDRKKQAAQASSAPPHFKSLAVPSSSKNDDDVAQIGQDVPNFDTVTSFVVSSSEKDLPPSAVGGSHTKPYGVSSPLTFPSSSKPSPPRSPQSSGALSASHDLGKRSSEVSLDRTGSAVLKSAHPSSSRKNSRLERAARVPECPTGEDLKILKSEKADEPSLTVPAEPSRPERAPVVPVLPRERDLEESEKTDESKSKASWLGSEEVGLREEGGHQGMAAWIERGRLAMVARAEAKGEARPVDLSPPPGDGPPPMEADASEKPPAEAVTSPPKPAPAEGATSDYLAPYHFVRALQALVHSPPHIGDRDAMAAERLGPAWEGYVKPLTYGLGMRYWDAQATAERHKRLRMMNQGYQEAWAKNPGLPRPGVISTDIPPEAVEAAKDDIITRGPPKVRLAPGPVTRPSEMPWANGAALWTFLEDMLAQTQRRNEAHDVLGAWAFAEMERHRPWEEWVELLAGGDAFREVYEVFDALDLEVRRARKRAVAEVTALPDGPAAWATRIRADLQLPGNTLLNTAKLATTPLRPAEYEEALDATRQAIEGGRVDHARSASYLLACLLRRGAGRV